MWNGLRFLADPDVYPPKPASILLTEMAIKTVKPGQKILDCCTGCGIVGIAVAKFVPKAIVTSSDINPKAIALAKKNAEQNNVKIKAVQSDFYQKFPKNAFEVITAHPPAVPYPPKKNWGLTKGMTVATNGGSDGSEMMVRAIVESKRCLKKNGKFLLLLPHWSNTKKAFDALNQNFENVRELAKKRINFFPVLEGKPAPEVLEHAFALAKQGTITIEFENKKPYSYASVIEATKTS